MHLAEPPPHSVAPQSRLSPASIALVVVGYALAFVLSAPLLLFAAGHPQKLLELIAIGGSFVWLVLFSLPLALVGGVVLSLLELHRPRPLVLHVLAPSFVAGIGLLGNFVGMSRVTSALAHVAASDKALLWFAGAGEAGVPRHLGYLCAGVALLPLALVALGTFLEGRRTCAAGRPFAAALLFALGAPASLWLLGRGFSGATLSEGMRALAMVGAEHRTTLLAHAYEMAATLHTVFHLLVGGAAVVGFSLLALAAKHAAPWARQGGLGAAFGLLVLGGVVAGELGLQAKLKEGYAALPASAAPEGVRLPKAPRGEAAGPPDLIVRGGALLLGGEKLGAAHEARTRAALRERLATTSKLLRLSSQVLALDGELPAEELFALAAITSEAGLPALTVLVDAPSETPKALEELAARAGAFLPIDGPRGVRVTAGAPERLDGLPRLRVSPGAVRLPDGEELELSAAKLDEATRERLSRVVGIPSRGRGGAPLALAVLEEGARVQDVVLLAAALPLGSGPLALAPVPRLEEAPGEPSEPPAPPRSGRSKKIVLRELVIDESGEVIGLPPPEPPSVRAIRQRLRASVRSLQRCYQAALKKEPRLEGKLVVSLTVDEEGRAREVSIESTTFPGPEVPDCIRNRVQRLPYPKPEGGPVTLRLPLTFDSGL